MGQILKYNDSNESYKDFPVVLFIAVEYVDKILKYGIQVEAIKQHW